MLDNILFVFKGFLKVKRRVRIFDKFNYSFNFWSIMKNCIGREFFKIFMSVGGSVG